MITAYILAAGTTQGEWTLGVWIVVTLVMLWIIGLFLVSLGFGIGMPLAALVEMIDPNRIKLNRHDTTGPSSRKQKHEKQKQIRSSVKKRKTKSKVKTKSEEIDHNVLGELISALTNLGYKKSEAKSKAHHILTTHKGVTIEQAIKLAVQSE